MEKQIKLWVLAFISLMFCSQGYASPFLSDSNVGPTNDKQAIQSLVGRESLLLTFNLTPGLSAGDNISFDIATGDNTQNLDAGDILNFTIVALNTSAQPNNTRGLYGNVELPGTFWPDADGFPIAPHNISILLPRDMPQDMYGLSMWCSGCTDSPIERAGVSQDRTSNTYPGLSLYQDFYIKVGSDVITTWFNDVYGTGTTYKFNFRVYGIPAPAAPDTDAPDISNLICTSCITGNTTTDTTPTINFTAIDVLGSVSGCKGSNKTGGYDNMTNPAVQGTGDTWIYTPFANESITGINATYYFACIDDSGNNNTVPNASIIIYTPLYDDGEIIGNFTLNNSEFPNDWRYYDHIQFDLKGDGSSNYLKLTIKDYNNTDYVQNNNFFNLSVNTWRTVNVSIIGSESFIDLATEVIGEFELSFFDIFPTDVSFNSSIWDTNLIPPSVEVDEPRSCTICEPSDPYIAKLGGTGTLPSNSFDTSSYNLINVSFWYCHSCGDPPFDVGETVYWSYNSSNDEWISFWTFAGTGTDDPNFYHQNITITSSDAFHSGFKIRANTSANADSADIILFDDIRMDLLGVTNISRFNRSNINKTTFSLLYSNNTSGEFFIDNLRLYNYTIPAKIYTGCSHNYTNATDTTDTSQYLCQVGSLQDQYLYFWIDYYYPVFGWDFDIDVSAVKG